MSLSLMLVLFQQAMAQSRTLTGQVTDQRTKEALPGVTVLLKGTNTGTATNADGSFTLANVPDKEGTLVISSIGYVGTEYIFKANENNISLTLSAENKQLNEVIVTALGIEKDTRSLGYATQQINADQLSQK